MAIQHILIWDEDNSKWIPAVGNTSGYQKVELSGTYSPDIVIITDGAGHFLRLPKLTTAERDALTPVKGMVIYNSTTDKVNSYEGAAWRVGVKVSDTSISACSWFLDEDAMTSNSATKAASQQSIKAYADTKLANVIEDTTPQLGGALDLNEKGIFHTPDLDTDGKWEGDYEPGVLGEAVDYGETVYLKTGDNKWWLTDASAEGTSGNVRIGICVAGGAAEAATNIMTKGHIREDDWNFTSYGLALFLDEDTPGAMNQTPPAASGEIVRVCGYADKNANVICFEPDKTWLELA